MPRIPFSDFNTAMRNPSAYRRRMEQGDRGFFRQTYTMVLREAIFRYHKNGENIEDAQQYLEERLNSFANEKRRNDTIDQFHWYIGEFISQGWPVFQTRLNIRIPLPTWTPEDLYSSGQISRIDLVPEGGYAAWLMRKREEQNWQDELQMPLIQKTLADCTLQVPLREISVGVICFEDRTIDSHCYIEEDVRKAEEDLEHLLRNLVF